MDISFLICELLHKTGNFWQSGSKKLHAACSAAGNDTQQSRVRPRIRSIVDNKGFGACCLSLWYISRRFEPRSWETVVLLHGHCRDDFCKTELYVVHM